MVKVISYPGGYAANEDAQRERLEAIAADQDREEHGIIEADATQVWTEDDVRIPARPPRDKLPKWPYWAQGEEARPAVYVPKPELGWPDILAWMGAIVGLSLFIYAVVFLR